MNIKEKIEELVGKITSNKNLLSKFEKNPVAVVEELIGSDLPDDTINKLVEGVKAKISLDKAGDVLQSLGGLFGKK